MSKTLYRITYYDGNEEKQGNVVADTPALAAAHLGLKQWQSAAEIARNIEVAGVDKQHAAIAPKPPDIMPPAPEQLTPEDVRKLKALVADKK